MIAVSLPLVACQHDRIGPTGTTERNVGDRRRIEAVAHAIDRDLMRPARCESEGIIASGPFDIHRGAGDRNQIAQSIVDIIVGSLNADIEYLSSGRIGIPLEKHRSLRFQKSPIADLRHTVSD